MHFVDQTQDVRNSKRSWSHNRQFRNEQTNQNALYRKMFSTLLEVCYGRISDPEGERVKKKILIKKHNFFKVYGRSSN